VLELAQRFRIPADQWFPAACRPCRASCHQPFFEPSTGPAAVRRWLRGFRPMSRASRPASSSSLQGERPCSIRPAPTWRWELRLCWWLRHRCAGVPEKNLGAPNLIAAVSGWRCSMGAMAGNSHPSQGLLDLFTLARQSRPEAPGRGPGRASGSAIIGVCAHSRVARSNLWGSERPAVPDVVVVCAAHPPACMLIADFVRRHPTWPAPDSGAEARSHQRWCSSLEEAPARG